MSADGKYNAVDRLSRFISEGYSSLTRKVMPYVLAAGIIGSSVNLYANGDPYPPCGPVKVEAPKDTPKPTHKKSSNPQKEKKIEGSLPAKPGEFEEAKKVEAFKAKLSCKEDPNGSYQKKLASSM